VLRIGLRPFWCLDLPSKLFRQPHLYRWGYCNNERDPKDSEVGETPECDDRERYVQLGSCEGL
jgi:hypothetical protein